MNWTTLCESSRFLRQLRWLRRESGCARAYRRMAATIPWLFCDLQSRERPLDDAPVVRVLLDSLAVRAARSALELGSRAARESQAARLWAMVQREVVRLNGARRIRMATLALVSAMVTHLVLTRFEAPEPTAAARLVWVVLLAFAAIVMAGASFLAAAPSDAGRLDGNGGTRE